MIHNAHLLGLPGTEVAAVAAVAAATKGVAATAVNGGTTATGAEEADGQASAAGKRAIGSHLSKDGPGVTLRDGGNKAENGSSKEQQPQQLQQPPKPDPPGSACLKELYRVAHSLADAVIPRWVGLCERCEIRGE